MKTYTALGLALSLVAIISSEARGGWTENVIDSEYYLRNLDFVDQQNGWAVGSAQNYNNNPGQQIILKTTNGGATWTASSAGNNYGYLFGVNFSDSQHGWVSGGNNGDHVIYSTINGGTNWQEHNFANTTNFLVDIASISAQNVWAVGDQSSVLYSTDGGVSFQKTAGFTEKQIWNIEMPSQNVGYFSTPNTGEIYKTINGGGHWNLIYADNDMQLSMQFLDENIGWVGGMHNGNSQPFVLHTFNGGATWTEQHIPTGQSQIQDISFVDSSIGWLVTSGYASEIWRTNDGGDGWYLDYKADGDTIISNIDFVDSQHGWATTSQGSIISYSVVAVPEPETWWLMLSGLALIGAVVRRKQH